MADFSVIPGAHPRVQAEHSHSQGRLVTPELAPIEATIDSSGLTMLRRVLMKGATVLGFEITPTQATNSKMTDLTSEERTLSLPEKITRALLETRIGRHLLYLGESLVDMAYSAWERLTRNNTTARSEKNVDYSCTPRQIEPDTTTAIHIATAPRLFADLKTVVDTDSAHKGPGFIGAALQEVAEAVRRKKQERESTAESAERARLERTERVLRTIKMIDACGGNCANNPEVAAVIASLGTPYDSPEAAIARVEELQRGEVAAAVASLGTPHDSHGTAIDRVEELKRGKVSPAPDSGDAESDHNSLPNLTLSI